MASQQRPQTIRELLADEIPSLSDVPREVRGALKIPLTRDVSSMHLLSYARAEIDEPISLSQPSKGIRRRKVLLVCTYNTLYVCDEEKGSAITIIPHSEVSELMLLGNGKKGTAGSSYGGGGEACDLSSAPPQHVDEFRNSKDSSLLIQSSNGSSDSSSSKGNGGRSFLALHFSSKSSASLKGSASAADMMTLVKTLHDKTHEILHDSATLSGGSAQEYHERYGARRKAPNRDEDEDDGDREDSIPSGPLTASAKARFDNNPAKAMAELTKALAKEIADEQGDEDSEDDEEGGNSSSLTNKKKQQQQHIIGFGIARGGASVRDKLASSIAVVNKAAKCVIELAATSPTKRGTEGSGIINEHEAKKDVEEYNTHAQEDPNYSKKIVPHIGPEEEEAEVLDVDDIEGHGDGGEDASSLCGSLQLQTDNRKDGDGEGGEAGYHFDEEFPLTPRYHTKSDEKETIPGSGAGNEARHHHHHDASDHSESANAVIKAQHTDHEEPLPLRSSSSRVDGDGGEIDNSSLTTTATGRSHTGETNKRDFRKSSAPVQEEDSQSPSSLLVDPNVLYMELKQKAEADELARQDALEKVLAEAASAALSSNVVKGRGEVDDNNKRYEGNGDYDPAQQSPYQAIGAVDFTIGPQRSSKTSFLNNKSSSSLQRGYNEEGHDVDAAAVATGSTTSKEDKEAAALEAFYKEQAADDERRRARAAKKAAKLEARIMEALAKVEAEEERRRKRMMKRRIRGVNRRYERMDMLLHGEIETFEDAVEGLEEEEREEEAAEAAAESAISSSSAVVGDGRTSSAANTTARVEPQEVVANGHAVAVHVQEASAPAPAVAFSPLAPLRSASSAPTNYPSSQQYLPHYDERQGVVHGGAGGGEGRSLSRATASASRTHSHQLRSRGVEGSDETASTRHNTHDAEATTNQRTTNAPFDVYTLSHDRGGRRMDANDNKQISLASNKERHEAFVDAVPQPRVFVDTARPLPMPTRVHQAEQSRTLVGKGGGVDPYFYSYGESEGRRGRPSSVSVPTMGFRDFADRSGVMSRHSTNNNNNIHGDDEYATLKAERDEALRRMALLEEELATMRQRRGGGGNDEVPETSRWSRSTAEDRRMSTNNNTNSSSTMLPHYPRGSSNKTAPTDGNGMMRNEAPPYHLEEEEKRHGHTSNYIAEEDSGERGRERLPATDISLSDRLAEQRRLTAILSERCFEAASALEKSKTSHDASLRQHLFEQQQAYEALLVEHHRALAETRELARDLAKEVAELRGSGGRRAGWEEPTASFSTSTVARGSGGNRPHLSNEGAGVDRLRSLYTPYSNPMSQSNSREITQLYDRGDTSAAFLSQLRSLLSPTTGAEDHLRLDNVTRYSNSDSDRVTGMPNASLYGSNVSVNQVHDTRGGGRLGTSEGSSLAFGSPFASRVGTNEGRSDINNNSINTTNNTTNHASQGGRGGQAAPRPFSPSSRLSRANAGSLFAAEERRREMLLDL